MAAINISLSDFLSVTYTTVCIPLVIRLSGVGSRALWELAQWRPEGVGAVTPVTPPPFPRPPRSHGNYEGHRACPPSPPPPHQRARLAEACKTTERSM
ncbi:hypothetical protein MRX96_012444 [Rhipicephalus microplus]